MTLLDQISEALGSSKALDELASTLGTSTDDNNALAAAGLPAILAGLGVQSGGDGIGAVMGLVNDDAGGLAENLTAFFRQGDQTGLASKLIGALFGSRRSAVESHVADASGSALSTVSRFLPMLAPAALSLLGKIVKDDGLDADGLGEQLGAFGATGDLGDILADGSDEDRSGFTEGIGSIRDAGGLGALIPAETGSAAAAAAPVAAAASVNQLAPPADDDDAGRTGLGWLPATVLLIAGLITGLVLWQCADDSGDAEPVAVAVEAEEPEAEPEPEPEPTEAPEPTAVPEPTATPEPTPEPTPVPPPTIAELALGNPDLSTLVGIAGDLDLVGLLSDPEAGPVTVFAPTNDAFAAADPVLARLDDDQTRTAVTFHVVDGIVTSRDLTPGASFDTLAGETLTVGDDGTLTGGVRVSTADIEASNGVVHVVENVLVPGSIVRSLAAEDVNESFVLNPIQFASGSAEILPESVPTLDEAIATLVSLPAGSRFEVQGHTDSEGQAEFNQTLSEDRAAAVVAYLVDGGVDADMLEANGYGESQLKVDPELTPEDFAANRRIEFVVLDS